MKQIIQYGLGMLLAGSLSLGGCSGPTVEEKVERGIIQAVEARPVSVVVTSIKYFHTGEAIIEDEMGQRYFVKFRGPESLDIASLIQAEIHDGDDETMTFDLEDTKWEKKRIVGCKADELTAGEMYK